MARSRMPCARDILPVKNGGTVMSSMTVNMTGRSMTRAVGTEPMVLPRGIVNGRMVVAIPLTLSLIHI